MSSEITLDRITGEIVDVAYGLLESVYEAVLARDLVRRGLKAERQVPLSFEYEGLRFSEALRIDLLVESCVIVEIKSLERLAPVHPKPLLTYLRLLRLPVGLLINFGAAHLNDGLKRIINSFSSGQSSPLRINRPAAHSET